MIEHYHDSILEGLRKSDEVVKKSVPESWAADHALLGKSHSSCFHLLCLASTSNHSFSSQIHLLRFP